MTELPPLVEASLFALAFEVALAAAMLLIGIVIPSVVWKVKTRVFREPENGGDGRV